MPFALFVSLSVNDNVLPSIGSSATSGYSSTSSGTCHLTIFFYHLKKSFCNELSRRQSCCKQSTLRFLFYGQSFTHMQTYNATQRPIADAMYYSDYSTASGSLSMSGSGSSLSYSKGTSKNTTRKGGIRGMLDSLNSHIAPGIVKNV